MGGGWSDGNCVILRPRQQGLHVCLPQKVIRFCRLRGVLHPALHGGQRREVQRSQVWDCLLKVGLGLSGFSLERWGLFHCSYTGHIETNYGWILWEKKTWTGGSRAPAEVTAGPSPAECPVIWRQWPSDNNTIGESLQKYFKNSGGSGWVVCQQSSWLVSGLAFMFYLSPTLFIVVCSSYKYLLAFNGKFPLSEMYHIYICIHNICKNM